MEPPAASESVTRLLHAWSEGDSRASDELLRLIFDDLRRLARAHMAAERSSHTLQPTALVHEVYLRLLDGQEHDWQNRQHFFGACGRLMGRILVDHARKHRSKKRGSGVPNLPLDTASQVPAARSLSPEGILALADALERLRSHRPRQARVVELRFFLGLKIEEVAAALDLAPRTVKQDWTQARAWLFRELRSESE